MSPKTTKRATGKAKSAPRTARQSAAKPKPRATAPKPGAKSKPGAKTKPRTAAPKSGAKSKRRNAKPPVSAPVKAKGAAKRSPRAAARAPRTLAEFMTQALVMEMEAAQRYVEFADAMEIHNNLEVAALFRKMADIEGKHAQQIMAEMGWTTTPAPLPGVIRWDGFEAPETASSDEVHYLMQPYHALEVALANELRAERFFAQLARAATTVSVRKAALELQEEEREHVALVRAWMKKVPKPDADWANDPDPPSYTD